MRAEKKLCATSLKSAAPGAASRVRSAGPKHPVAQLEGKPWGRTGTGERELTLMSDETRVERRLDRVLARARTVRGAVVVIAAVSTSMTVGAGILMTVADHDNFPSVGSGLWWAVQTVTTVGYGDHVPGTVAGRLVAALVMLAGIGFLTVITAAITSSFVSRSRFEQTLSGAATPTAEELRQINGRLERIEAALASRAR
jgi:voltage-gated potassium channel